MEKINILGVNISVLAKKEILESISQFLKDGRQHQIATANPEFLLAAQTDEEFFHILNTADLAIPDGVGLKFAALMMGDILQRIAGVDLIFDICALAQKLKKSVYLLGGDAITVRQAEEKLKIEFPELKIAGAEEGLKKDEWKIEAGECIKGGDNNKKLLARINLAQPDIIFVAFGHPAQEKWIWHNLLEIPTVKIAMGVGGSFDFIAGRIKRAPKFLRILGLEWLWRVILEPWRWKRIINAVIIFPLVFLKWKVILPFFYRKNIACLIYKKENNRFKILIVKRSGTADHWQIPQGGLDGEPPEQAALKEIKEELGTDKIKVKAIYKDIFKYDFNERIGKYNTQTKKARGYKGQIQSLCVAKYFGDGNEIKINFWDHADWKWVESENFISELYPSRRDSGEIFLKKLKEVI